MTYDFGLHFTQELGNRFGPAADSWPATAERVTPFLAIVVDALGVDEGLRWFEAARQARQRVLEDERDDSYSFGFAHYLDTATEAYEDITLPVVAAFEALKGGYEVARRESRVDVDVYFECAAQACSRLGGARRDRMQQLEQGRERRAAAR
ncbi:hypothetical protein EYS09_07815 [Streptomyces kasugaensis]|uniref:Uncharacterized protein n=1 Tax=Streptomyces kasugaensis TaxID=1946 RepID=A0A4Q9HY90_STRKA|nr:hypothetical protein [Streptomyces kasugaensis]TBO60202.1 hypothetical protein EYS09_07815 [Streptomyces kasugaensis]